MGFLPDLDSKGYLIKGSSVAAFKKPKRVKFQRRKIKKRPTTIWKYKDYIKSKAWRRRKAEYFKRHPKRCAVCRNPHVDLHHISYRNIGNERDDQLIPLYRIHHDGFHSSHGVQQDMTEATAVYIQIAAFEEEAAAVLRNI